MTQNFSFEKTRLAGLWLIKPFIAPDERGCLIKDYSVKAFADHGLAHELKEVFYTTSRRGVLRGLHFQREKQQAKLVRCLGGKIYDVAVDLRAASPTFGQWQGFCLSEENSEELYVPEGFGHGFLALEPSMVSYKCSEAFYAEYDDGIIWNDADIKIDWPLDLVEGLILSRKDQALPSFAQFRRQGGSAG